MSSLTIFIHHSFESPSHSNWEEKVIKGIKTVKENVKLSVFTGDLILYIENPEDATRN